jgi:hypothetical protein
MFYFLNATSSTYVCNNNDIQYSIFTTRLTEFSYIFFKVLFSQSWFRSDLSVCIFSDFRPFGPAHIVQFSLADDRLPTARLLWQTWSAFICCLLYVLYIKFPRNIFHFSAYLFLLLFMLISWVPFLSLAYVSFCHCSYQLSSRHPGSANILYGLR